MDSVWNEPLNRPTVVSVALLNNEVAGAVVGLFGFVFIPVRSLLQAVVVSETIVTSAAESRVIFMSEFSRFPVTA